LSGSGSDVLADGPQKSSYLMSNGGDNDGSFLANRCKPAKPTAQANLDLPGHVTNRFRNPLQALLQCGADPSLTPICPSALDQTPVSAPVAGQGQIRPVVGQFCKPIDNHNLWPLRVGSKSERGAMLHA
jgi:hypothetical protein